MPPTAFTLTLLPYPPTHPPTQFFIAGSLTVIGSPMGFARKVGTGVKSFFYEPYKGAVDSPHDFVVGLGKGTSNLFQVCWVLYGLENSILVYRVQFIRL